MQIPEAKDANKKKAGNFVDVANKNANKIAQEEVY